MSRLVKSLKRLYKARKVSQEKLNKILLDDKITEEELDYIIA